MEERQPMTPEQHAEVQAAYADRNFVCSLCEQTFEGAQAYRDHTCPKTGYTPKDNEHFGAGFADVAAAAQARGAETGPVGEQPPAPEQPI